ncbi:MAG: recombinase RecT [Clostridium sp.]|jgi:recombination protein RecT|nr:recombinase RecT [Clostridium sp.]
MNNPNSELANPTAGQAPARPPAQPPKNAPLSASQRFTNLVLREYAANAPQGVIQLNERQRRLIQGYFVMIDRALKTAEEERLRKNKNNRNHDYDSLIPYGWNTVNMTGLALDAVHYARMGLDMQEKNHLFPIPYVNKKGGFYDIAFMLGYSGIQYIAEKYAMTPPKSVTIELVYSNDAFKALKKSRTNPEDAYEFEIVNPFDRGEIVGGFGYIGYEEPAKNQLIIMTRAAMDKRKPKYASAEFWGGLAKRWENSKQVEVELEGWPDEMYRKTLIREVYSGKYITRDPSKIDDSYQYLREREVVYAEYEAEQDALENANRTAIDTPSAPLQIPAKLPDAQPQAGQRTAAANSTAANANQAPDF